MVQGIAELLEGAQQKAAHCERHGAYQARWVPQSQSWSGCPHCLLEKIAQQDARERQQAIGAHQMDRPAHRLSDASLEALRCSEASKDAIYARMRKWAANVDRVVGSGAWMLLAGGCGCGKSFALRALAAAARERGFSAVLLTQHRALAAWREDHALLQEMRGADIVLLDECNAAQSRSGAMFDWLNERYELRKACVFAGNAVVSRLSDRQEIASQILGEPLADRLLSCGDVLPMAWASRRAPEEDLPF